MGGYKNKRKKKIVKTKTPYINKNKLVNIKPVVVVVQKGNGNGGPPCGKLRAHFNFYFIHI